MFDIDAGAYSGDTPITRFGGVDGMTIEYIRGSLGEIRNRLMGLNLHSYTLRVDGWLGLFKGSQGFVEVTPPDQQPQKVYVDKEKPFSPFEQFAEEAEGFCVFMAIQ